MIYYVEDDVNIRDLAIYALKQAGFEAQGFPEADEFFAACKTRVPDLVLLDIMLPGTDGLEILRMIRDDASMKTLPVMMLTAKGTEYDTVCGLDAGADDYLAKPFGMMELVSRVNALLRRAHAPAAEDAGDVLASGPIVLTSSARTVTVDGEPVALTLKEFDLLRALMANEGRVLSRSQLLEEVWGVTYVGETRTVDVHIQTLRQKLARVREGVDAFITTVTRAGFSRAASCSRRCGASPTSGRRARSTFTSRPSGRSSRGCARASMRSSPRCAASATASKRRCSVRRCAT